MKKAPIHSYPKPGPTGGRLIRQVISLLRAHQVQIPIDSHILIGISGGADSVALAHLFIQYGRRIVDRSHIKLVHINHGWRGAESKKDALFVRNLAKQWRVPLIERSLKPHREAGSSWEERARTERYKVFRELAKKYNAQIFTAHHADDLFETVLWRIFTGTAETHGGGVAVCHEGVIRPLLAVQKCDLVKFLEEEKLRWKNDETNEDPRFLRAAMRLKLIPEITRLFPKALERVNDQALRAQRVNEAEVSELGLLIGASGLSLRKTHWTVIQDLLQKGPKWVGEIHLPDHVILRAERISGAKKFARRWVLERRNSL